MYVVESANYHQRDEVMQLVNRLLDELREGGASYEIPDQQKIFRDLWASQDRVHPFVARNEERKVVGLMTLVETFAIHGGGNYGIIDEMYVLPEHRGKGVGRQLMQAAGEFAIRKKWSRIDTTVPAGERWMRTINFYQAHGFKNTGPKLRLFLK